MRTALNHLWPGQEQGVQTIRVLVSGILSGAVMLPVWAQTIDDCIGERLKTVEPTMTVGELRAECVELQRPDYHREPVALRRLAMERRTEWNPFVITPHKQNYILPVTYIKTPNTEPYEPLLNDVVANESLDNEEIKLQISLKVPLTESDILVTGDSLHFGFTLQAYWQFYNKDISSPFRETNYQPEFFYSLPLTLSDPAQAAMLRFGIEHQSNGQSQILSRSWNRVYTQFLYARNNYVIGFRPWYRIPEKKKDDPLQAKGDDNPDIDDYFGYFELTGVVEHRRFEYSVLIRNNVRDDSNRGALELGVSFPFFNRLRGYVQYFNGYGESLIDYDHHVQRIGVGILLTDLM